MTKQTVFFTFILISSLLISGMSNKKELSAKEELGKLLFFDSSLSTPIGQACADCHGQRAGWSGPDSIVNRTTVIYPGALKGRFGNRRPPSAAYAGDSPKLHRDEEGTFIGGLFWDGRASGHELGDPLAEQAMGPFLNPLEQNIPDQKTAAEKVKSSAYTELFTKVWGPGSLDLSSNDKIAAVYEKIARSIAAFERSDEVNPYSSLFDEFWFKAKKKGLDVAAIDEKNVKSYQNLGLDSEQLQGLMLFNTKGLCAECHLLTSENDNPPLFTDFTYDNLGVPFNPDNPFLKMAKQWNPEGKEWRDKGLGGYLEGVPQLKQYAKENYGKYKVPTLRNVDLRPSPGFVRAYMHNGFFKTLEEVVNFYNTRDVKEKEWPASEIADNVNVDELGNLKLTEEEEKAIVTFMKTLSDR